MESGKTVSLLATIQNTNIQHSKIPTKGAGKCKQLIDQQTRTQNFNIHIFLWNVIRLSFVHVKFQLKMVFLCVSKFSSSLFTMNLYSHSIISMLMLFITISTHERVRFFFYSFYQKEKKHYIKHSKFQPINLFISAFRNSNVNFHFAFLGHCTSYTVRLHQQFGIWCEHKFYKTHHFNSAGWNLISVWNGNETKWWFPVSHFRWKIGWEVLL